MVERLHPPRLHIVSDTPERLMFFPITSEALLRETSLPPDQIETVGLELAEDLRKSCLRHHPDALRIIKDTAGEAAYWRAVTYLSGTGFPTRRPHAKPERSDSGRRTPAPVRALWGMCKDAVDVWCWGFPQDAMTALRLTLSLSWGLHTTAMRRHRFYRDDIRRRYRSAVPAALLDGFDLTACRGC